MKGKSRHVIQDEALVGIKPWHGDFACWGSKTKVHRLLLSPYFKIVRVLFEIARCPLFVCLTCSLVCAFYVQAMQSYDIDIKKMPLGAISKNQIRRGFEVLEEIQKLLKVCFWGGEFFFSFGQLLYGHKQMKSIAHADATRTKRNVWLHFCICFSSICLCLLLGNEKLR